MKIILTSLLSGAASGLVAGLVVKLGGGVVLATALCLPAHIALHFLFLKE